MSLKQSPPVVPFIQQIFTERQFVPQPSVGPVPSCVAGKTGSGISCACIPVRTQPLTGDVALGELLFSKPQLPLL